MCQNAQLKVAALFNAEIPTVKSLMAIAGVSADTQTQVIEKLNIISADIQNWKKGTAADSIIQAITDVSELLSGVIPPQYVLLLNVILGAFSIVIAVLKGNSPASVPPNGPDQITQEEIQEAHAAAVVAETAEQVKVLVPSFKLSRFHTPESQYKSAWNKAVDEGNFPATMKV